MRRQRGTVVAGGRSASKRTSSTRSDATSERRRPPEPKASSKDGAIPNVGGPIHPAGAEQCLDQIARQRTLALAHRRSRRRSHREAQGRADLAVGEGALEPAPAVHRAPESEPPADRRRRMRSGRDKGTLETQGLGDLHGHAVLRIDLSGVSDPRGDGRRTSGATRGRRARAERLRWPRGTSARDRRDRKQEPSACFAPCPR